jgi:Holliday junction resolvase RusA-like endonuclease
MARRRDIPPATPIDVLTPGQLQLSSELAASPHPSITFVVSGRAATKGSYRVVPNRKTGKSVPVPNSTEFLKQWTDRVRWSARAVGVKALPKPGAVGVRLWFYFTRPASAPVSERPRMTEDPDIDKTLRATLDALTGFAYQDDSQVTAVQMVKRYGPVNETYIQIWEDRS